MFRRLASFGVCAVVVATAVPANAQVLPAFSYGEGPVAAARLGFCTALAANLLDTPHVVALPSVQLFYSDLFARLDGIAPTADLRDRARALRAQLADAGKAGFDRAAESAAFRAFNTALVGALPPALAHPFVIGGLTDQIAYNALAYREPSLNAGLRGALGTLPDLDAILPGFGDARASLIAGGASDWRGLARAAERAAAVLLGTDAILVSFGQPPRPDDVWLTFVRFRQIAADGPRKGTVHASLDIVRANGSHTTIGAYPNGAYAFDQNGGTLVCVLDREPDDVDSRALVVVPPMGTAPDDVARKLLTACDALGPAAAVTYDAAGSAGNNDNGFVAGALRAAGLDPAAYGFDIGSSPAAVPAIAPAPPGVSAATAPPAGTTPVTTPSPAPAAGATPSPAPVAGASPSPGPASGVTPAPGLAPTATS